MNSSIFINFDQLDDEKPYKAIADVMEQTARGTEKKRRGFRFETQEDAYKFYNNCIGFCILSKRLPREQRTKILKYKFN